MPYTFPKCEAVPVDGHQVSFRVEGVERLRWHYGAEYPRPFLYPLIGPAGVPLTRMGHPGAPDHDHHRSIWFAHNKVQGVDFWGDPKPPRVRQKEWFCYEDGEEARMAVRLGWNDGHDAKDLMEQELIIAVRPGPAKGETLVELQTTFKPTAAMLELDKTNFGFLAVRVAKSISKHFGGGELTNSEGLKGEPAIFGKRARWMDYSGPVTPMAVNGIGFFDHLSNPGHPTHWHVREDGWMGASACFAEAKLITKMQPLVLRYLLWAHDGDVDAKKANEVFDAFAKLTAFAVVKPTAKHVKWAVRRV